MNWLLIVLTAGNFTLARITDTEKSCVDMGTFYTQTIEQVSFVCVRSDVFTASIE